MSKGETMHVEDFLSKDEFQRLLAACKTDREAALLRLMAGAGLRVSELASLKVEHIDAAHRYIYVKNGKGHKERSIAVRKPVLDAVKALNVDKGYLFPGGYQGSHITPRQIANILDEIAKTAGLQVTSPPERGKKRARKRITPHLLRHSYASWLLDMGYSISDLQNQLGHDNIATTNVYLQRRPNHRRANLERLPEDGII